MIPNLYWIGQFGSDAESHEHNVVKMAEHYMSKGNFATAINLLNEALQSQQPSLVI